jgi:hypothetical protein
MKDMMSKIDTLFVECMFILEQMFWYKIYIYVVLKQNLTPTFGWHILTSCPSLLYLEIITSWYQIY